MCKPCGACDRLGDYKGTDCPNFILRSGGNRLTNANITITKSSALNKVKVRQTKLAELVT